ncbi:MAG: restriction endonuclease subunit S [Candidatus Competibacteraceae bacterium]|nr:restriction endonuclease subunit S [Candidatus Competibacteraceae bacterium]MCB1820036.1 restriction endonuclease subunit S [Candidatus Competibacteraceae bacterium]
MANFNRVPQRAEWTERRLIDLAAFDKGHVVACQPDPVTGSRPYIGADSFTGAFKQFTTDPVAVLCEPTDVLMLWDGERSGLCATGLCGAIGSTVARLRPKSGTDGRFLYHQLARHFAWIQARRTGTGIPHVPKDIGNTLFLLFPTDPAEQSRIAAILDTVDEAIAKTEAVIAKLKQVRAGLLHDLLTRGLDENGQLRDPIAHPEQFQDSLIGRIPLAWEVFSLEELLDRVPNALRSGPFGSALLKQELKESGIPLLGIDNVHVEHFVTDYRRFVSHEKFLELKRYAIRPLDVMITVMGTVGRCCVVPDFVGTALSSKHVWTITFDRKRYSPHLACWQMNYAPWILRQLRRDEQGGVMTAIRSETLRNLLFPVPSLSEIQAIEVLLQNSTNQICAEKALMPKLVALKSALMTDLLTGRVRALADLEFG